MKIERTEYVKDGFIISDGGLYGIFNRATRGKFGGFDLERLFVTTTFDGGKVVTKSEYIPINFVSQSSALQAEKLMVELGVEILEAPPELT